MAGVRRTPSIAEWEPTESGWRHGRYEVVLHGPGRWTLDVDGRTASSHGRASSAAAQARQLDRQGRRRRVVGLNLTVVALAGAVMVVAQIARTVPNRDFAPASAFALELEAAYRSVAGGDVTVESFQQSDGIVGDSFVARLPIDLGGDASSVERSYLALVARHNGECYAIRWSPGGAAFTGVLAADLPCEPAPRLIQSGLFVRAASQQQTADAFDWSQVLPPPTFQARWFVPLLILMLFVALQGGSGIVLAFIRRPRGGIPALRIDANRTAHCPGLAQG